MSSSKPATRPTPNASCRCSIATSPAPARRRGRPPPMGPMPAAPISPPPRPAALPTSPFTRSAASPLPRWSRALGLPSSAQLPRWHRGGNLLLQARVRRRSLHLARPGALQGLHLVRRGGAQPGAVRPAQTGLAAPRPSWPCRAAGCAPSHSPGRTPAVRPGAPPRSLSGREIGTPVMSITSSAPAGSLPRSRPWPTAPNQSKERSRGCDGRPCFRLHAQRHRASIHHGVVSTGAPTPGSFGFHHPETTPSSIPTASRTAPHPAGDKDCRSGLIQPERVESDHVVDAEIILRVVALHVVVPDIEDIFPRDRHQRRVLLHDVLGLPNERQALSRVDFDVDLID